MAENERKHPAAAEAPADERGEASLWTSSPKEASELPSLHVDVTSGALRQVRAAVQAAESETKRFEGHASVEAMKHSCA